MITCYRQYHQWKDYSADTMFYGGSVLDANGSGTYLRRAELCGILSAIGHIRDWMSIVGVGSCRKREPQSTS